MRKVMSPTHSFAKKAKSISNTRKGDPIADLEPICPGLVAALKISSCAYCGVSFAGGLDRVDSKMSYPESAAAGMLVPCCSDCNHHLSNWKTDDVLVQATRNVLYLGENFDPGNIKEHSVYTTSTDGMMSYVSSDRKPLKCIVQGVEIMFPSRYSFDNFGCKLPSGTLVEPATVLEYKEWRKNLSLDKQEAVREALGIHSLSEMRKEAFAAKDRLMQRDELLSQKDAEESSNENKARAAQLVSSSSSSSSAMEHDSDQPNSSDDEDEWVLAAVPAQENNFADPDFGRASFVVRGGGGGRGGGGSSWRVSVFDLDMTPLGHFSQKLDVLEFLPDNVVRAVDQLSHAPNARMSIGEGGRKREMFVVTQLMEGASMGLTELGEEVVNSIEVKYPNGIAIEESNGNFLAGCRSGTKAAKLIGVSRQRRIMRLERVATAQAMLEVSR